MRLLRFSSSVMSVKFLKQICVNILLLFVGAFGIYWELNWKQLARQDAEARMQRFLKIPTLPEGEVLIKVGSPSSFVSPFSKQNTVLVQRESGSIEKFRSEQTDLPIVFVVHHGEVLPVTGKMLILP